MKPFTLITGASSGFGRALALEYAIKKIDLILVALPNSGLLNLGDFLKQNFSIDVIMFELDLSSKKNCQYLYDQIKCKDASVKYLVNNAGVLSNGLFEDLTQDYFLKQIQVNISTPTLLTKLFMDDFKANAPSGVLNVSSMASFFHLPKKQVYGGTKAYLLSFSKSLRKELKKHGIWISIVCPGGMNTTTALCLQNRRLDWVSRQSILDPERAARITIKEFFKKKEVIIPGRMNKVFLFLDAIIPNVIKNKLTNKAI